MNLPHQRSGRKRNLIRHHSHQPEKGILSFEDYILNQIHKGNQDIEELKNINGDKDGDPFDINHQRLAYGKLKEVGMIEENNNVPVLTPKGKKYLKRGYRKYILRNRRKKRIKKWFKDNGDNLIVGLVIALFSFLLGVLVT